MPESRPAGDVLNRNPLGTPGKALFKALCNIVGHSGIRKERQREALNVEPPSPRQQEARLRIGGFDFRLAQPCASGGQRLPSADRLSRQSADPFEPFSPLSSTQRFDDLIQSAVKHLVEVVGLIPGPVIDNPVFREVVGADAL